MQDILRDGNCLSIVSGWGGPQLTGAGIITMEKNSPYTKVQMKGEFRCHTWLNSQTAWMYVESIRFRVAEAIRTSPLGGGIACETVEMLIVDTWRKVFGRIILLSRIEMWVRDDEVKKYEYLLGKSKEWRLVPEELFFMRWVQQTAKLFLQGFKEALLCEKNTEEWTAGEVMLF